MILFSSNADTELLAVRSALEDLPAELADVRWFHPCTRVMVVPLRDPPSEEDRRAHP